MKRIFFGNVLACFFTPGLLVNNYTGASYSYAQYCEDIIFPADFKLQEKCSVQTTSQPKRKEMKKIIIALALLAATGTFNNAQAQVSVSFNIGTQPLWGPTGYDYAQYYYMPELDVYYDIQSKMYYYSSGRRWVGVRTLPARYSRYNLYNTYKVVLNERNPWTRAQVNRQKYGSFRDRHDQGAIRDSRDNKYWESAQHPHHSEWRRDNNNNNGRGRRDNVRRESMPSNGRR